MTIRQKLQALATEKSVPCVTISLNTFRTHPDNAQFGTKFKNLLTEAEKRVTAEFGKRPVSSLLEKLSSIESEINANYNLDSLHLYLSNDTKEVIRATRATDEPWVHISDSFNVQSLIEAYDNDEEYLILLLSQSGVTLYNAASDGITHEVRNEDFPFSKNRHYNTHADKGSDPKHLDNLVREFLNKVDKAIVSMYNETGLQCVVICTEDNYSRLLQVADKPTVYLGHAKVNYNKTDTQHIAKQGWEIMKALQDKN
jgi:hypothetical protein